MKAPTCQMCGKPLRRYKYRSDGPRPIVGTDRDKQWGDYGDNLFCGVRCGYQWAKWALQNPGEAVSRFFPDANRL